MLPLLHGANMLTFACSQYDGNFHGSGGVLAAVLHECGRLGGPPILRKMVSFSLSEVLASVRLPCGMAVLVKMFA